jgi:hypothetical protein
MIGLCGLPLIEQNALDEWGTEHLWGAAMDLCGAHEVLFPHGSAKAVDDGSLLLTVICHL